MRKSNALPLLACAAIAAVLLWGLEQAALAPLETGDVYPAYSSLRSDPLGAKALYESLASIPGIEIERLYKQRTTLEARDAVLVLGVEPVAWSGIGEKTLEEYEKLVNAGGRLIIGLLPVREPQRTPHKRDMEQRWNLKFRYAHTPHEDSSGIPSETALYFEAGPEWRGIAGRDAVERAFGKGYIVLAADTFPLSNQGLRDARDAKFISALIGPATRIAFDENHFGVVETGSVTKLMRKYHLEAAVAMLALAAALFLWRSASSFLPPRATRIDAAVSGRDSVAGMTALLHRGVKREDLIETCLAEWMKSASRESRAPRVGEEIRRWKNDPVEAYRAASKALVEKT